MSDVFKLDGVANIPIEHDKPVVCLILTHQDSVQRKCRQAMRHDDFYRVYGTPIFGKMNEFCGLDNMEYHSDMETLLKSLPLYVEKNYKYVPYKWVSMKDFMYRLKVGELYEEVKFFLPKREACMEPLEYILVHHELYDQLLHYIGGRNNSAEKVEMKIRSILKYMASQESSPNFSSLYTRNEYERCSADFLAKRYLETKDESLISAIKDMYLWEMVMAHSQMGYFCHPCGIMETICYPLMAIIHKFALSVVGREFDCDAYNYPGEIEVRPFYPPN